MTRRFTDIRTAGILTIVLLVPIVVACSFSDSSKSISRIVSGPIKSSSDSSSPEQAYKNDVADYPATYIKSGGDATKLKAGISTIAEKRGVTDWEKDSATYQGIGEGFKRAGLK